MKKLNVLLTGAASGIGRATAERLIESGHTVYALDVKPIEPRENLRPFVADITDGDSLRAVFDSIRGAGTELDTIICAAGVHDMASLVEGNFERIKRLTEINLIGTMRTVHELHSLLRRDGRVVIVTSEVATYTPMPFNGLYNISKTALECYADALRQELNLLGQKVVTIRPGAVETPLAAGSATATDRLAESTVLYKEEAKHFSGIVKKFTGTPMKPERLARLICRAVEKKHPRLSYAKHRNPGLVMLNLLPRRLQCFIIKLLLKRK